MKKIKTILLTLFLVLTTACSPTLEVIQLKETVEIDFFYIQTCSECKAFKEQGIDYLEKKFGDSIVIKQYDLDEESTKIPYDEVVDSLVDWDQEFYGNGPFIAVKGYFAYLGYTTGDEEYIAQDIMAHQNQQELTDELMGRRFLYK